MNSVVRIIFGVVVVLWTGCPLNVTAGPVEEREPGLFAAADTTIIRSFSGARRMSIRSAQALQGTLSIEADSGTEIRFTYHLQANTRSRGSAISYLDVISVVCTQVGDEIRLEFRCPNPPPWDSRQESAGLSGRLTVPLNSSLEIAAPYFHVDADGPFAEVIVPSSLGRQSIRHVTGRVEVTTNNQKIELRDISGVVRASTSNATMRIERLRCEESGATLRNDGGDILLTDVDGSLNIRNRFGRIDVARMIASGNSFIRGNAGPVRIELLRAVSGQLVLDNELDDIELQVPPDLSAYLSLSVDSEGSIDVRGLSLTPELVQRNRLNLTVGEGAFTISASIDGRGTIMISTPDRSRP